MRKKINETVVSGEAWASAIEKVYQYWPHALGILSMTGLGTWFATGWKALSGQGWGLYPLVGVAVGLAICLSFAALSFGVNYLRRNYIQRGPVSIEGDVTPETPVKFSSPPEPLRTPSVEFAFPSNWTPGFRIRELGTHDATREHIHAEEIQLRVAAKKRMQSVRFELTAKRHTTDRWETVAQVGSEIFNGTVQKGQEQRFTIMHRLFRQRIGEATVAGERQSGRMRVDMETIFFPDNESGRFMGKKREQYSFHVTVFHDDGPESAYFVVRLERNREFPQSQITDLNNIQPIMGH